MKKSLFRIYLDSVNGIMKFFNFGVFSQFDFRFYIFLLFPIFIFVVVRILNLLSNIDKENLNEKS